jgi:nucleotide-binding universal stress UspA family protein
MTSIQRILCPIDFSDASRHALEHAVAIAKWYDSAITALHVIHPLLLVEPPILFAEFPKEATAPELARQSVQQQLKSWLEPATAAGVQAEMVIEDGDPARSILARARAVHADLVAMGTHGLSGFERFMLGSVTEKILRKATCPVLTVPPSAATVAKLPYTRLLCPVDFSASSLAALQVAFSMAQESNANLTILHVFDWPSENDLFLQRFDEPTFRRFIEEETRGRLEALVTGDLRLWCHPTTKVGYGTPYRQILKVAEEEETDLIVIGVRGRNSLDLTLFGSTTNQVVRRASCPVLTLRR